MRLRPIGVFLGQLGHHCHVSLTRMAKLAVFVLLGLLALAAAVDVETQKQVGLLRSSVVLTSRACAHPASSLVVD